MQVPDMMVLLLYKLGLSAPGLLISMILGSFRQHLGGIFTMRRIIRRLARSGLFKTRSLGQLITASSTRIFLQLGRVAAISQNVSLLIGLIKLCHTASP
jgi:hypothetical protein